MIIKLTKLSGTGAQCGEESEVPFGEPHARLLRGEAAQSGGSVAGTVHRRVARFHVGPGDGSVQVSGHTTAATVWSPRPQTAFHHQ